MTNQEQFRLMGFANRIEQHLLIALSHLSDAEELASEDEEFADRVKQARVIIAEELGRLHPKSRP